MPPDTLGVPDILLMVAEEVLVFDNLAGTLTIVVNANAESPGAFAAAECSTESADCEQLSKPGPKLEAIDLSARARLPLRRARASNGARDFEAWVDTIKESILVAM